MTATHLVVDGSNIATEGRTMPSLAQLDEAVRAFIAERPHDIYTVVVDATFEHRIDASERKLYDEALANNELIVTPAGTVGRGDRFILEVADRAGATVLSNDSFQEFHGDYKWLFDAGRLIGGRPVPGVGWIFVERTPVRGPKSRQATREASRKRGGPASKEASAPMPVPKAPPPAKRRARGSKAAEKTPAAKAPAREPKVRAERAERAPAAAAAPEPTAARTPRPPRASRPQQPLNDQLPFITFIADHLPGSTVEGEVVEFSSHGAYVQVGDVRCYIPLKNMASPAPRSAREVLERGETRSFVVQSIEAARRGIDLALPGFGEIAATPAPAAARTAPSRSRGARARATEKALPDASPTGAAPVVDKAPAEAGAKQPQSEATLAATKKAAGRKTAAKKTTARKATAKKATAKKTTARKAPAKRSTAKKATARKAPAKKAGARKSTAKKATARKSTAKKATARKSTAKKAGARKSTAKKAGARKSTAKKATARKSTAKKAGARKSTAKKAGARKSSARKTTARKTTARKAAKKR
jgi:hypothetical protein